jgi:peptidoglycan/LPS O-acetylase OafA/YrhL
LAAILKILPFQTVNEPSRIASSPREIKCLTGLRFVLSTWVVMGHQAAVGGMLEPLVSLRILRILDVATLAVSGFFCLSGFILAYNYSARLGSLDEIAHFMGARLARIYPVYLLGLLIFLPYAIYHWHAGNFSSVETLASLALSLFLLQSFIPPLCLVWNAPGWSLSAEFFFYATLPLYAVKLKNSSNRALVIAFTGCLLASLGGWLLDRALNAGIYMVYAPFVRVPEFAAGYIAGLLYLRRGPWNSFTSAIALALSALVIIAGCDWLPPANYFGVFPVFFIILIYSLANPPKPVRWLLGNPLAVLLGEVSYGMYIFHTPISFYFKSFEKYISRTDLWHHERYLAFLIYFLVVVGFSGLVFMTTERPLRKRLAPLLAQRTKQGLSRFY